MIIKVKIGDLTARQMAAICNGHNCCDMCPLHNDGDSTECSMNNDTIPNEYDLDREIEVSTDLIYPEAEPFEKRFEKVEALPKEVAAIWLTLKRLANILGYEIGPFSPDSMSHKIVKSYAPALPDDDNSPVMITPYQDAQTTWKQYHDKLTSGELGDPTDKKTLIKYWEMLRDAGYPFAQDQLNFLQEGQKRDGKNRVVCRCDDCVKFDECKDHKTEDATSYVFCDCKAFERKESKQGKKNDHCDTCLFYGEDGICVVHKEKIARPYKKSCPAYLPSAVQLDLDEKLFQLKARRAYVYNYSFDTTVPCKDCVYCNPRTKKCFINYPKPETWDGEDGDYYCGHGVERSKSE